MLQRSASASIFCIIVILFFVINSTETICYFIFYFLFHFVCAFFCLVSSTSVVLDFTT